jgi:hypothetical protein
MMSENSGIIYDLGEGRFGVAIHKEQVPAFKDFKKVYLHVYLDRDCSIPERNPTDGKKYVTLKHISKIKPIGFQD